MVFYENVFPYKDVEQCIQTSGDHHDSDFLLKEGGHSPYSNNNSNQVTPKEAANDNIETESILDTISGISTESEDNTQSIDNDQDPRDTGIRRSTRQRKTPSYLKEYIHQVNHSMTLNIL